MAATIATMAMLNAKCLSTSSSKLSNPIKPTTKPISLLSIQNLPKGLTSVKPSEIPNLSSSSITGTAIAGAIFSTLTTTDAALAAQQIAQIADGDSRGTALLLPIIPAIGWVLFNIFQPALNQINRMRSTKGVMIGLGLGGLAAYGFGSTTPEASASEFAAIAEAAAAASSDNRGQLLLFVVAPAIAWVLFNILQPALNQINRMRSE
ncbi:photosystem II core complex proteins psbY, chloroplastic-like [Quillaja saponaria]|uniref:Photosystem II core complex proteins psbY, chloroplastic-like n=1 Tax=Quillaja saponaria TaxID=32244 RepID=A0AAD7LGP5_QUISA|nr:photosystem II core complex proteins psbY, chloroplastic-like [Quillaja saponaria]